MKIIILLIYVFALKNIANAKAVIDNDELCGKWEITEVIGSNRQKPLSEEPEMLDMFNYHLNRTFFFLELKRDGSARTSISNPGFYELHWRLDQDSAIVIYDDSAKTYPMNQLVYTQIDLMKFKITEKSEKYFSTVPIGSWLVDVQIEKINPGSINSPDINEFRNFLENICHENSDTVLNSNDTLIKYKVAFTSQGEFIDPKNFFSRICSVAEVNLGNIFAEISFLKKKQGSPIEYNNNATNQTIKTCINEDLWGMLLPDSIIHIKSEESISSSRISAKEIRFSQAVPVLNRFKHEYMHNTFFSPSVISYQNGRILIVDIIEVIYVGNQTDKGNVTTFYLERID